jgi:S-adenosylmethionine synthetase
LLSITAKLHWTRALAMRNIVVEDHKQMPLEGQRIEIVERKGLGHPDYICDAVMDQISISLSKEYISLASQC